MSGLPAFFMLACLVLLCGCSTSNVNPGPVYSAITGSLELVGPEPRGSVLAVSAVLPGLNYYTPTDRLDRQPSLSFIHSSMRGNVITVSLVPLYSTEYEIVVHELNNREREYYRSPRITAAYPREQSHVLDDKFSYTGPAPFGSASGSIQTAGVDFEQDTIYLGFTRDEADAQLLLWPLRTADIAGSSLDFNVPGLAHGSYQLGIYGYRQNPGQSSLYRYGWTAQPLVISASAPAATGIQLTASAPILHSS